MRPLRVAIVVLAIDLVTAFGQVILAGVYALSAVQLDKRR